MREIVVGIFDDQSSAVAASGALKDLNQVRRLRLYESTVVFKDRAGTLKVIATGNRMPLATLGGLACGALIGGIGGPLAAVAGALVGTLAGLFYDVFSAPIDVDLVDEVKHELEPGQSAVIADIGSGASGLVHAQLASRRAQTAHGARGGRSSSTAEAT